MFPPPPRRLHDFGAAALQDSLDGLRQKLHCEPDRNRRGVEWRRPLPSRSLASKRSTGNCRSTRRSAAASWPGRQSRSRASCLGHEVGARAQGPRAAGARSKDPAYIRLSSEVHLHAELDEAAGEDHERLLPGRPVSVVQLEDGARVEQVVEVQHPPDAGAIRP